MLYETLTQMSKKEHRNDALFYLKEIFKKNSKEVNFFYFSKKMGRVLCLLVIRLYARQCLY